jgi:hypothetical protein
VEREPVHSQRQRTARHTGTAREKIFHTQRKKLAFIANGNRIILEPITKHRLRESRGALNQHRRSGKPVTEMPSYF